MLRKAAKVEKGSGVPNRNKVGKVTKDDIRKIAERKLEDLNATDLEAAEKIIMGTARSMGIEIK
jgi:large subunit ribosomal protein L11